MKENKMRDFRKGLRDTADFIDVITTSFVKTRITNGPLVIAAQSVLELIIRKESHPLKNAAKYCKDSIIVTGVLAATSICCKIIGSEDTEEE